jgi:hypothetical protein
MTKNGLDIQAISTKRTDFQTDHVLLFRPLTKKQEKANPSHFLNFFLANRTSGTFGFALTHKADPSAKPKEPLIPYAPIDFVAKRQITFKSKV